MVGSPDGPHWFRYFPDNYHWSQVFIGVLNLAPMGGGHLWEVDQVGNRLKDKVGDYEAWYQEWTRMADYVLAYGEEEEKKGHSLTAGGAYVRSAIYRFTGDRLLHHEDPRKRDSYRKLIDSYERGMRMQIPEFERVEVPYENNSIPAYWLPPLGEKSKVPAVVFFDGLDASKESTMLWGGLALRRRGIGCLCVDGPGQGETLRLRNIPSRYDYEVPAAAAYDFITTQLDVDPMRIGLMANSLGGYYAPRAAAFEHRFAGCVAWGGHYDFHETQTRRRKLIESGGTVTSSASWHLPWVMGCPDIDSALKKCEAFKLDGIAEKIRMPILIVHGVDDALVPLEMVHRLFNECGSANKELKLFRVEDGASQHCLLDNLSLASNYIADWWMDRFR